MVTAPGVVAPDGVVIVGALIVELEEGEKKRNPEGFDTVGLCMLRVYRSKFPKLSGLVLMLPNNAVFPFDSLQQYHLAPKSSQIAWLESV